MQKTVKVYSPAHLSTIFQPYRDEYYLGRTGSRGTGITVEEGVNTTVKFSDGKRGRKLRMVSNGEERKSTPTEEIFKQLAKHLKRYNVVVSHSTSLPFESGNGLSAAVILNTAFGLYHILPFKESDFTPVVEKCHVTEVRLGTGLGDIGPMFYARGIDFRTEPGVPGYKEMRTIPYSDSSLLCFYLGKIKTKHVLGGDMDKITKSAAAELSKLSKDASFENFIECSKRFAKDSGLMPAELEKILEGFDQASMIMLGNAGFVFGSDGEYERLLSLGVLPEQIIKTRITKRGTSIVQ
ncbi:hypothetical protein KY331_04310 [Candidatus Woesearchaeota archaeon]|nr:hypothetical protein [Candidatus Woesearchaeota archaeon]